MKVYLGGPINGCTDEEASGWREAVKKILDQKGYTYNDPMDRDYRGRELEEGIAAKIVEGDKEDIAECDILLMNCPKPSWGTAMEIFWGWACGKNVLVVLPEGTKASPWIIYHTSRIYYGSVLEAAKTL